MGEGFEGKSKGHLRVVSEKSPEDVERFKRMMALMTQEFTSGSFEEVLARRDELYRYRLKVEGITDPEAAAAHARELIPEVLEDRKRVIDTKDLPPDELKRISQHLGLNVIVGEWLAKERLEFADTPDLPHQNIERYVKQFRDLIWRLVGTISHREELESELLKKGVDISDQDVTRLLVYELNKDLISPKVLVLPNDHKPYNPYFVLLKGSKKLPAEIMRLLSCFNR